MTSMVFTHINIKSRVGGNWTRWGIRADICSPFYQTRSSYQKYALLIPVWNCKHTVLKNMTIFWFTHIWCRVWFMNVVSLQSPSLSIHIFVKPEIQQTSKDCDVHVSRVETSDIVFFKFKDLSKRYRMPLVDFHANPSLSELITLTWDALKFLVSLVDNCNCIVIYPCYTGVIWFFRFIVFFRKCCLHSF